MKRFLLIPVMALMFFACKEKHVTNTETPGTPDPNGYTTGTHDNGNTQTNTGAAVNNGNGNSSGSNNSNGNSNTAGSNVVNPDTVVTVVVMPDNGNGTKVDSSAARLVVSFISKGEGTDKAAKANLDKWLSKHPDVKYHEVSWGREGEVDYIFDLKDKRPESQNQTVADIRTVIGTNDRVLIQEWATGHEARNTGIVPPADVAPVDSNIARVVVSFISKGEGIDHKTQTDFEQWLTMRGNVTWEVTHWGREGELNYCFHLYNMDARQQEIFVRDVRNFLTGKELVQVNEYAPCDKRK